MATYEGSEGVISFLSEIFASPLPQTKVKRCQAIFNLDIFKRLKPMLNLVQLIRISANQTSYILKK